MRKNWHGWYGIYEYWFNECMCEFGAMIKLWADLQQEIKNW